MSLSRFIQLGNFFCGSLFCFIFLLLFDNILVTWRSDQDPIFQSTIKHLQMCCFTQIFHRKYAILWNKIKSSETKPLFQKINLQRLSTLQA